MKRKLTTLLTALFCLSFYLSEASHTMGGDFTYRLLSTSGMSATYELTLIVYRDCSKSTALDNTITVKSFYAHNNQAYNQWTFGLITKQKVLPDCVDTSVACIEQGIYRKNVTFTSSTNTAFIGFNVVWSRCCRSTGLSNVTDNQGQLWSIFIPPYNRHNSSVQYLNVPIPFLCNGRTNSFNLNAYDPDGDSLVFSLVRPYIAGGTTCAQPNEVGCNSGDLIPPYKQIAYRTGFNVNQPFGSSSSISINPRTGEITATVNGTGNYVIAIEVEEFRKINGVYVSLGKTRRDLQYIVRNCTSNQAPFIDSVFSAGFDKYVMALDPICFKIRAYDLDNDSVFLSHTGAIFDNSQGLPAPYATLPDTKDKGSDTAEFCWAPGCPHVSESPYFFTIFMEDNKCNQRQKTYSVKVNPRPDVPPPKMSCADVVSASKINLTWMAPTDTSELVYYQIFRKPLTGGTYTQIDTLLKNGPVMNYLDATVPAADTMSYLYFVGGVNQCGDMNFTSDTILSINLRFNRISLGKGTLNWNAPDTVSGRKYYIARFNGSSYSVFDSTTSTSYLLNRCEVNTDYRVYVNKGTACTMNSNSVNITLTPSDSIPPESPLVKYVSVATSTAVKLEWALSSSPYAKYYEVWRSTGSGIFTKLASLVKDTVYNDAGIDPKSNVYGYYIIAKDSCPSANVSLPSDTVFTLRHGLSTGACVPLVRLNWNVPEHFSDDKKDYQVLRSANGGPFISIKTLGITTDNYVDSAVGTSNLYCYMIKSNSTLTPYASYTDTFCVVPSVYPAPAQADMYFTSVSQTGASSGQADMAWHRANPADTLARGYRLYSATDSTGPYSMLADLTNLTDTTYSHASINTIGGRNFYFVRTYNLCDDLGDSSEKHGTIVLSATGGNLSSSVSWTPYKGWPVKRYVIYRGSIPSALTFIDSVAGNLTTYTDTSVSCGNSYYYRVAAVKQGQESIISSSNYDSASVYDLVKPLRTTLITASVLTTSTVSGQIVVTFNPSGKKSRASYNIYRKAGPGSFTLAGNLVHTALTPGIFIDTGLNTETQVNSYYVTALDSCGNESAPSDTQTVVNASTAAGFAQIDVSWTPYFGFANYQYTVERSSATQSWAPIVTLSKDSLHYTDKGTLCQTQYYYRIRTVNLDVPSVFSYSDTVLSKAFDTVAPAPGYVITATLESPKPDAPLVVWAQSPEVDAGGYELFVKPRSNGSWVSIYSTSTVTDTFYVDSLVTGLEKDGYCYRVVTHDLCGNTSLPGNMGCIITLHGKASSFENLLNWNDYTDWPDGVQEYNLYRSDNGQPFAQAGNLSSSPLAYIDDKLNDTVNLFCYYVEAKENTGGFEATSRSNTVCVSQKASYYIPSAFTPGQTPGLNDFFGPEGSFIYRVDMQVYNRWGELVFESAPAAQNWDGRDRGGMPAPSGVYFYKMKIYSFDRTKKETSGVLTLIR